MRCRVLLAVLLSCSCPRLSLAADTESANALVRQGADLFKGEDYEGARAAFERAYELDPKAGTLFNLALSELNSNHPVEAAAHFRDYLAHTDEPEAKLDSVRTKWLPRASAHTALLNVFARPGAQIAIDGVVQKNVAPPPGTAGNPIASIVIPAGEHEVTATQGTMVETQHVAARGGELAEAHFQRVPDASAAPRETGPNVLPGAEQPANPEAKSQAKWSTVITLGSGAVVAAALGVGFSVATHNKADEARKLQAQVDGGPTKTCQGVIGGPCSQLKSAVEANRQDWAISVAAGIGAGVFGLASIVAWRFWPTHNPKMGMPLLRPVLSSRSAGLELGTQW
jgi:hypothetical protein